MRKQLCQSLIFNQVRNQEFFRAGEVSEHKGTSTNIYYETYERKALQGKISEIFFPRYA